MKVPSMMFIESALARLKEGKRTTDPQSIVPELRELRLLGDARIQNLGASGISTDFEIGYLVGLETARIIVSGSMKLALAKVNPDDVL